MEETPPTPRYYPHGANPRTPACDNCRDRKTKCDRGAPCSSCVTASLPCRVTRGRPEKRQRILISAKYDEALESVDDRLRQLQETVNALHRDVKYVSGPIPASTQQGYGEDLRYSNGWVPRLPAASLGYRGGPSFEAQAGQIPGALNAPPTHPLLESPVNGMTLSPTPRQLDIPCIQDEVTPPGCLPNLGKHPLPPSEPVQKLLRLSQTKKQRFFVDVFVLDEQELSTLCREVFFPINPYTFYTWSIVNVGLFYLFTDLKAACYPDVGVDGDGIARITQLLAANVEDAVDNFRVSSEPSIEACQALALLGTFCIKSGQITRAWTLVTTAARMCIDLGFHRLPPLTTIEGENARKHKVFWHLYTMETGLALTLGRTQSLHLYDIATERPSLGAGVGVPGIPGKIYAAFFDMAILQGEIQPQLFSAAAEKLPRQVRSQRVTEFRARLGQIQAHFNRIRHDPLSDSPFGEASVLLNLLLHSLVTVVCGATEPNGHNLANPSQQTHSCADCIGAARECLTLLVKTGSAARNDGNPEGWARFLNIFLSLAPFTPYIVLVAHATSSYTSTDLHLLASVHSVLEPVAESSPMVAQIFRTCAKLYQLVDTTARSYLEDGPAGTLLPGHSGFTTGVDSSRLSLRESLSSVGGVGSDMPLGDYQMMLAGIDGDTSWRDI